VAEPTAVERDLQRLESEMRRLEAEYNMFFSGRSPKPPWETRSRVDAIVKQFDRAHIQNYGDRFRFTTLQSRYATLIELWDRGLRARDEGRSGPFARKRTEEKTEPKKAEDRVLRVAAFKNPVQEEDKLHELYDSLVEARRSIGEDALAFDKFADLVKTQVKKLRENGSAEVAFRVAVKDGKVNFTARAMKGTKE
jgi:hypothetical protein